MHWFLYGNMATIQHIAPDAIQELITCYDMIGYDDVIADVTSAIGKNESIYDGVKHFDCCLVRSCLKKKQPTNERILMLLSLCISQFYL